MYDGVDDFFEVKFHNLELLKYFPVNSFSKIRFSSSILSLKKTLKTLSEMLLGSESHNKTLKSHQGIDADEDLSFLTMSIVTLIKQSCLTNEDKNSLKLLISSLVLEVSDVYGVNQDEARGIVSEYMRCA